MKIRVKKRNGRLESLNIDKINSFVERAAEGIDDVSASEVALTASVSLYDGIKTNEITDALILSARQKIEKEPNYSYLAARMLLHKLYKEVFNENADSDVFELQYRKSFVTNIKKLVKAGRLHKDLLSFDLKALSEMLVPKRDMLFQYLGIQTLYDRYLIKSETPQAFWMRVAMGLSYNEPNKTDAAVEIYNAMSEFRYCHSTPTLFNSGTVTPQLSSCFLSTIGDSIDGIFGGMHEQARLSKHAGGLGVDFSSVRTANSFIRGTAGHSNGVVPWLKIFNDTLLAVNQGGKRPGAGCAYLEVTHQDIEDFIDVKKNTGDERRRCHEMNTAVWIPDAFMRAVENDADWVLFNPDALPHDSQLHELYGTEFEKKLSNINLDKMDTSDYTVVSAKELWKKIIFSLKTTGHPWIAFKDTINNRYSDSHAGVVHNSNLCTEITRHTIPSEYDNGILTKHGETAVCNLASVNLTHHIVLCNDFHRYVIDYDLLKKTVRTAIRALDNVIDINYYPIEPARLSNSRYRPIGLGVMGMQDVLYSMNIDYDSDRAVQFNHDLMERISYYAIEASADLAEEKGAYPSFDGSLWSQGVLPIDTYKPQIDSATRPTSMDWDSLRERVKKGMRNGNVLAIAPTATISFIQGCSQSIEPDYSTLWVYSTLSGEFPMINRFFVEEAKRAGIWCQELIDVIKQCDGDLSKVSGEIPDHIKQRFRTVFRLDHNKLIECNAARQRFVDQAISFNIYSDSPSLKYLSDLYFLCWKMGLKTTYYLRGQSASKTEKSTVEPKVCSLTDPNCESCQ